MAASNARLDSLSEGEVARLRDQLRAFVAGQQEIEQAPEGCDGGSGPGHSSHCDNDGWV